MQFTPCVNEACRVCRETATGLILIGTLLPPRGSRALTAWRALFFGSEKGHGYRERWKTTLICLSNGQKNGTRPGKRWSWWRIVQHACDSPCDFNAEFLHWILSKISSRKLTGGVQKTYHSIVVLPCSLYYRRPERTKNAIFVPQLQTPICFRVVTTTTHFLLWWRKCFALGHLSQSSIISASTNWPSRNVADMIGVWSSILELDIEVVKSRWRGDSDPNNSIKAAISARVIHNRLMTPHTHTSLFRHGTYTKGLVHTFRLDQILCMF